MKNREDFFNIKVFNLKRIHLISIFLITLATMAVYGNSLNNEFTNWDDNDLILNNIQIRSINIDNVIKIFDPRAPGTYQPMRVLSYALDYFIGEYDPLVYHIHSGLLHILASIFLYLVLMKLIPQIERGSEHAKKTDETVFLVSFFSALLFALHPVNTEAVTWLSSRKYVLLSFFTFVSFFFYLQRPVSKKLYIFYYILSFFFWILAVMSSPFGIILPALFLLGDYCCSAEKAPLFFFKANKKRYIPYIVVGVIGLIYLLSKLGISDRIISFNALHTVFLSMMKVFFDYMRNFLFPFWLNNRYVDYVYASLFSDYKVLVGLILIVVGLLGSVFFVVKRNNKLCLFVVGWFMICWLPASNIIPISTRMADRYVYLASVGFFIGFSEVFFSCISRLSSLIRLKETNGRKMAFFLMIIVISFFSILAVIRNNVWQDSGTLWQNSLLRDPKNTIANNNYGKWLYTKGDIEKAKKHLLLAHHLKPSDDVPLLNLGYLYFKLGDYNKAEYAYDQVLAERPDHIIAHRALFEILSKQGRHKEAGNHLKFVRKSKNTSDPIVINQKGLVLIESKKYMEAEKLYNNSIESFPAYAAFYYNLGVTLKALGSLNKAMLKFEKATEIKPDYALAFDEIGQILYEKNKYDKALNMHKKALEINSGLAEIYNNMGNVYFAKKKYKIAYKYYKKSTELNDDTYEAFFNQCAAMEQAGEIEKALDCYMTTLEKFGNSYEVLNNLGGMLIRLKRYDEAEKYLKKALKINKNPLSAHYNLALLYYLENKLIKSFKFFRLMDHIDSKGLNDLHNLCAALADKGELKIAENCYRQVLQNDPESAVDYFHLGIVMLKQGHKADAKLNFKIALDLDPENSYIQKFISYGTPDLVDNTDG